MISTNESTLDNQFKGSLDIHKGIQTVVKYSIGEQDMTADLNCLNIFARDEFYLTYVDTATMTTKQADSLWNSIKMYLRGKGYPEAHLTFDWPIGNPDED